MGLFSRRSQTSRSYPAAGTAVAGDSGRFFRAKTSGARRAGRKGQAWEDADRDRETGRRTRRSR